MAIKSIIEKLEDAPENIQSLYRAGTAEENLEGKFVIDVEPVDGFGVENVSGLKNALSAERGETQKLKGQVKAFEGIDPDKAKEAIAKIEELGTLDPKKDVDRLVEEKVQAQLKQVNDRHATELEARDKKIASRDGLLRKTLVHDAALKAITAEKGDPELLMPHVLPSIQLELEEDEATGTIRPKTKVVGPDGNVRIGDSQGGAMTIDQLVGELKTHDKFSRLFEGSGHAGTGTEPNGQRRGTDRSGEKKVSELSRKDKAELIGKIGLPAFQEKVRTESAASVAAEQ